jgi:thiol-disulfide isomerase/thioredoxin
VARVAGPSGGGYGKDVIALLLATRVLLRDPFPAVTLPAFDGHDISLPAAGDVLVVEVFATWCVPCKQALPILERLRHRFAGKVTFVPVSEDDGEEAREKIAGFLRATGFSGAIFLDSDHALYRRLGVRKLPTAYIVDRQGVVRHIDNGFGPGYEERLTGWLRKTLREGEAGATTPSKPTPEPTPRHPER